MHNSSRYLTGLLALCVALTAYRIAVILMLGIDTYVDEAYYWGWSQALEWGYYSKPPMIAAMIAASDALFGPGLIALKLPSLISYPLTALVLYRIGSHCFAPRVGFWAGALFMTMPLVGALGMFVSTDAPLLLFWACALYALIRALETAAWRYWLVVGLCFGVGLMTKYTMAAFAGSAFLVLIFDPRGRRQLASLKPWAAVALGVMLFVPNILWNIENGFPTFRHTAEITRLDSRAWAPDELGEFIGAQWASLGPVLGITLIVVLARFRSLWHETTLRILLLMAVPLLLLVSAQALTGRANGNWAAPSFIAIVLFVPAALLAANRTRLLRWAVGVNLILVALLYHWPQLHSLSGNAMSAKLDPYKRARGWSDLAAAVAPYLKAHPDAALLSTERETLAQTIYYARPDRWYAWHPGDHVVDQYELKVPLTADTRGPFLLVIDKDNADHITQHFETSSFLGRVKVQVHPDMVRMRNIYRLDGFRGYQ